MVDVEYTGKKLYGFQCPVSVNDQGSLGRIEKSTCCKLGSDGNVCFGCHLNLVESWWMGFLLELELSPKMPIIISFGALKRLFPLTSLFLLPALLA